MYARSIQTSVSVLVTTVTLSIITFLEQLDRNRQGIQNPDHHVPLLTSDIGDRCFTGRGRMLCGEHDIQALHDGIYQPRETDGGALCEQSLSPIGRSLVAVLVYLNNCDLYICTAMDCRYI